MSDEDRIERRLEGMSDLEHNQSDYFRQFRQFGRTTTADTNATSFFLPTWFFGRYIYVSSLYICASMVVCLFSEWMLSTSTLYVCLFLFFNWMASYIYALCSIILRFRAATSYSPSSASTIDDMSTEWSLRNDYRDDFPNLLFGSVIIYTAVGGVARWE